MDYTSTPDNIIETSSGSIAEFTLFEGESNVNNKVVEDFGNEWLKFNNFDNNELEKIGKDYFDIIDKFHVINSESTVLDAGCGTGRWSKVLCKKVKYIEAIDPSNAVLAAQHLLKEEKNIRVTKASIDTIPFANNSFDLVMSIGVLHHIPDTENALKKLVDKINKGGNFYGYLYYNFENRGGLFKSAFWISNLLRIAISSLPTMVKKVACDLIAVVIYFPFSIVSRLLKRLFSDKRYYQKLPLSYYHDKSILIMRNDALDRFGTRLEKRYSKSSIIELAERCGLTNVKFSDGEPYWHFIAEKK